MNAGAFEHNIVLHDDEYMPIVGFGTWQVQGESAYNAVRYALEIGYRHLDTATVYENEDQVGRGLDDSGVARDDVFVTTKLPPFVGQNAQETFEASLRALRTDYVDLWLIHWPQSATISLRSWEAMVPIFEGGKARAIGVSNFSADEIDQLVDATSVVPAVNQIRWSPFLYDANEAALLAERGVVLEGYSPLKASRLGDSTLVEIANRHEVSPAQVVLRWHVQHDVVVIPKSVRNERIAENLNIFHFLLSDEEMTQLDTL